MRRFSILCSLSCLFQITFGQAIGYNNAHGIHGLPGANIGLAAPGLVHNEVVLNNGIGPVPTNVGPNGLSLAGLPISAVSPIGFGDVAIAGELPVGGSTAVVGNVPIIGFVTFEGILPAGGTVALASNCGCNAR